MEALHWKSDLILATDWVRGVGDLGPVGEWPGKFRGALQDKIGGLLGPGKDNIGADVSGDDDHPA